jgi:predicted acetyltransferase
MNISIVDYAPHFKPHILNLFKKTFQKEMSEEFWNWRFEKNPYGNPIIKLTFLNEKLVGNYLLHPVRMEWNKKSIRSLFSMTTMTDPDFSGKGIMTNLATKVYESARSNNFDFIFAFVNNNSRYLFTKKLGFKQLQTMSELSFDTHQVIDLKSDVHCEKIDFFDDSFSNFYNEQTNNLDHIIIPRTKEYLNWRYVKHPEISYYCHKILLNNILQGFFILKIYQNKTCHIVDFFIKNSEDVYKSMITTSISFCKEHSLSNLTLWINRQLPLYSFLQNIGFHTSEQSTYFVVKKLNPIKFDKILFDYNKWYITMGDSDVY